MMIDLTGKLTNLLGQPCQAGKRRPVVAVPLHFDQIIYLLLHIAQGSLAIHTMPPFFRCPRAALACLLQDTRRPYARYSRQNQHCPDGQQRLNRQDLQP